MLIGRRNSGRNSTKVHNKAKHIPGKQWVNTYWKFFLVLHIAWLHQQTSFERHSHSDLTITREQRSNYRGEKGVAHDSNQAKKQVAQENIFTKPRFKLELTHISELNQSQFSQLTDTIVSWAGLKEELHQTHLLTAEQRAHNLPAKYEGNNSPVC